MYMYSYENEGLHVCLNNMPYAYNCFFVFYKYRSAVTIHKFCGLKDGRYDNEELVDLIKNSESFEMYKINIHRCDVLVIGK